MVIDFFFQDITFKNLRLKKADKKWFWRMDTRPAVLRRLWRFLAPFCSTNQSNFHFTRATWLLPRLCSLGKTKKKHVKNDTLKWLTPVRHQLIRLPHYRMPVDEDFPSVVAITLIMKSTRRHLTLDLQSNVPFADLLALFREVEKNVDGRVTKNGVLLAIKIAKDCVIQEIEVYSFKSVKPITSLPKPLVLKVWDMLVRSGIVEL